MEEYRIQMAPCIGAGPRPTSDAGSRFRAVRANGWGPRCWHTTLDAAIDCLEARISLVLKPALLEEAA